MIPKGLSVPLYSTEASGEFGAVFLVMLHTFTADAVTGTAFFRTGTVYSVMRTMRHGGLEFNAMPRYGISRHRYMQLGLGYYF